MLRAMDSAVAGLRAHQNKLDVIGHNIANVNTLGFKSQVYYFKEAMYQTVTNSTSSMGASGGSGGVNSAQYGYGTMMGSIGVDMTASTPSYTGGLTATIDGEGFFMTMTTSQETVTLQTGLTAAAASANSNALKSTDILYTRVGQFQIDSDGYLVDANGNFVYGYRNAEGTAGNILTATGDIEFDEENLVAIRVCDANGKFNDAALQAANVKIDSKGQITVGVKTVTKDKDGKDVEVIKEAVIGCVAIATFQNQEGLTKAGGSYYSASQTDNTGVAASSIPGQTGTASLMTGYLEASNVDLAKEFSELITTQRGFQANTRIITVSDQVLEELVNMKR